MNKKVLGFLVLVALVLLALHIALPVSAQEEEPTSQPGERIFMDVEDIELTVRIANHDAKVEYIFDHPSDVAPVAIKISLRDIEWQIDVVSVVGDGEQYGFNFADWERVTGELFISRQFVFQPPTELDFALNVAQNEVLLVRRDMSGEIEIRDGDTSYLLIVEDGIIDAPSLPGFGAVADESGKGTGYCAVYYGGTLPQQIIEDLASQCEDATLDDPQVSRLDELIDKDYTRVVILRD